MTLQTLKKKILSAKDVPQWVLDDIEKVEVFELDSLSAEIAALEGEIELDQDPSDWWKNENQV